jgi:hypothetical protein
LLLGYDAVKAMWFTDALGAKHFGIGVGTLIMVANVFLLSSLHVGLPFAAASGRRIFGFKNQSAVVRENLQLRELPEQAPHDVGVDQFVLGRIHGCLHPPLRDGHLARRSFLTRTLYFVATNYETHEYDVLVIGAGGAGLRAAIEASAAGVKVGLICKSLLGKAHTVMAEGGMAAAMGNVDDRDSWKVHFADTMRGGQYVNNWRMAELHAKEAPARVHELEAWGAVFDRTKEGKISQRNFGGHRYPRLAHVGDRTGLELIRTLQDHGIHQGITVHMEYTIVSLLKDGDRVVGAFGYDRERGRFRIFKAKAVVVCTGGLGRAYASRAIPGKARATAFRSRITRARNCSTWNSSSFIRPA